MPKITIGDVCDLFRIRSCLDESVVEHEVFQVAETIIEQGEEVFLFDHATCDGRTSDIDNAEVFLKMRVERDGCCELQAPYLQMCGFEDVKDIATLIKTLYVSAMALFEIDERN